MSNPVEFRTSVCAHDCPDTCSLRVGVRGGRIVSISGDAGHPVTQGFLCGKVNRCAERVYSPSRIPTPPRRAGAKGGCARFHDGLVQVEAAE